MDVVPDPSVQEPTDAIVHVTSLGHLRLGSPPFKVLGMFMEEGDILGHEAMGVVEERPTDPETGEVGLP